MNNLKVCHRSEDSLNILIKLKIVSMFNQKLIQPFHANSIFLDSIKIYFQGV